MHRLRLIATTAAVAASLSPAAPASAAPAPVRTYSIATSASIPAAPGKQSDGVATCPSRTVAIGGGALVDGSSLSISLNGSVPSGTRDWLVYVDNTSSTAGSFRAYAVCVKKVAKYRVVVGTAVTNAAGFQSLATASCPTKTVPLGGGGLGTSSSPLVSLNSSIPTDRGWQVDVNNASTSTSEAKAYVVCGAEPAGYWRATGTHLAVDPHSQGGPAVASCPSGSVVLSGGAYTGSSSRSVSLNSTSPAGTTGWQSFLNNASAAATTVTTYVVCASGA